MSVTINKKDLRFTLKTDNTMYVIGIRYGKFPVHLHYGKKTKNPPLDYHSVSRGFEAYYEEYGEEFIPDSETMEFPFFGSGDYRAVALKLRNGKTGGDTTIFCIIIMYTCLTYEILSNKYPFGIAKNVIVCYNKQ